MMGFSNLRCEGGGPSGRASGAVHSGFGTYCVSSLFHVLRVTLYGHDTESCVSDNFLIGNVCKKYNACMKMLEFVCDG